MYYNRLQFSISLNKLTEAPEQQKIIIMNMKTCFAFLVCAMSIAVMNATTDAPILLKNKLDLSIYYSARSTDSIKFILTKLKPLYCKIQKYVDLNLVPFGKGYITKSKNISNAIHYRHLKKQYKVSRKDCCYNIFHSVYNQCLESTNIGFFCQNGHIECRANTIHNCVFDKLSRNSTAHMEYLSCALEHIDNTIHVEEMCAGRIGLSIDEIQSCATSREGYLLMLEAEIQTKDQTHGPRFVPSYVFDEFYNERDQRLASTDFEATLCGKLINDHGFLNVCNNINNVLRVNEVC